MKRSNRAGRWLGGAVFVIALGVVFFYRAKPVAEPDEVVVRPVKNMLVGVARTLPALYFPGIVQADSEASLSFEVGGRLIDFPARRGMVVEKGEVLARLDPSNYANQVKNAEAELERARSSLERIERALASGAVSQEEFSQALAARNKAEANLAIQRKALDDTLLRASFGGVVSDTFVDTFDTVSAGRLVLKLQDVSTLAISISVAESYMLLASAADLDKADIAVEFDWLPGRSLPAKLKEFATNADPVTRTYRVTFTFNKPDDVVLLPDVAGTVVVKRSPPPEDERTALTPSDAIGFTVDGQAFVWVLDKQGEGVYTARRRIVEVGDRNGEMVEVVSGLSGGTRIATAGVAVLSEGRLVRLLPDALSTVEEVE